MLPINCTFNADGAIKAEYPDVIRIAQDTKHDRDRWGITEWIDQGNIIAPYVAPPPPTDQERIDSAFPQTDTARVMFNVIWIFFNEIEALKINVVFDPANPIFTKAEVKTKLKKMLS